MVSLLVLLFCLSSFLSTPVSAGSYAVTYSGGQATVTGALAPKWNKSFPDGGNPWSGGIGTVLTWTIGTTLTVNLSGQITATFTWVPDPHIPNDQPPGQVIVGQGCSVTAPSVTTTYYQGTQYTNTTVSDNGLGGAPKLMTTKYNPGSSFTETCSPSVTLTATGGVPSGTYFGQNVSVGLSYSAWIDTRSVTIGAATSAKVTQVVGGVKVLDQYQNIQYVPGPEPVGSAGETYGDLGLPYHDSEAGNAITTPFVYYATTNGSWDMSGAYDNWYSSEHGVSQASVINSTTSSTIPTFAVSYVNPDNDPLDGGPSSGDMNTVDHVHLTFTDGGDWATATGNLYMTLHPLEVSTALSGPTSSSDPNFQSKNSYPATWTTPMNGPGSTGSISWTDDYAVYGAINHTGNILQGVSSALYNIPYLGAVFNIAGVTLAAVTGNPPGTASEAFNDIWPSGSANDVNVWASPAAQCPGWQPGMAPNQLPNPLLAASCTCSIQEVYTFTNKLYGNDEWGQSGYVGYTETLVGTSPGHGIAEATWTYAP